VWVGHSCPTPLLLRLDLTLPLILILTRFLGNVCFHHKSPVQESQPPGAL
jgi:hypothetical protein